MGGPRWTRASIERLAVDELRRAGRPRGSHPAVIAQALGVEGLPCASEDARRLEAATATSFRYAWLDEDAATHRRAFLGLARSLLLRAGVRHGEADARALSRRLEARPDLG